MLILVKIEVSEFERLKNCEETYFCNGCIFEKYSDNIVSFGIYESNFLEPKEYYKVLDNGK